MTVMTEKWPRHVFSTRLQMAPEYLCCTAAYCIYKIAYSPPPKCHAHDTDTMLMHVDHDHDKVLVVVRGGDGKAH